MSGERPESGAPPGAMHRALVRSIRLFDATNVGGCHALLPYSDRR